MPRALTKPLKVGFDLDGVLLYNPARLVRPIIKFVKRQFFGQQQVSFFVPKTPFQRFFWNVLHESSFFIAPGLSDIKRLVDQKQIEAYIITGRFDHLLPNTQKWINRLNADHHFKAWYHNQNALQPHLYKESLIRRLNLDIFIDDNYDIAQHLRHHLGRQTQIYWIYNFLDRKLPFPSKFGTLNQVVKHLQQHV